MAQLRTHRTHDRGECDAELLGLLLAVDTDAGHSAEAAVPTRHRPPAVASRQPTAEPVEGLGALGGQGMLDTVSWVTRLLIHGGIDARSA
jgi:hypothetical protein